VFLPRIGSSTCVHSATQFNFVIIRQKEKQKYNVYTGYTCYSDFRSIKNEVYHKYMPFIMVKPALINM